MEADESIAVGLVEDDRSFRDSVRMLLEGTPGYSCAGAWSSLEAAIHGHAAATPRVVLLDIQLPGRSGDEGVGALLERFPGALVLMLTASADDDKIFASLCRGACGYLLKSTPPASLLESISEAVEGGSPMSPVIARKVVTLFRRTSPEAPPETPLTPRETELLGLLAEGRSYQTAAEALGVSINTVRNHVRSVYEKLQVHTRSEAVSKGLRAGLI